MPFNTKIGKEYEKLWEAYQNVNITFAKKACVATDLEDDAMIWFQSYHLLIAPNFVRRQIPTAQIGLFVHTVFPTSEVFRCLPTRTQILRGMLSSDLIGFHTFDYCRHFLSSCKRTLDLDFHTLPDDGTLVVHVLGRDVSLRIGHVSVRSDEIRAVALSQEVSDIARNYWRKRFGRNHRRVIFVSGDYSRRGGLLLSLQGFQMFLGQYPQWVKEITIVILIKKGMTHTYRDLKEGYKAMREQVIAEITAIRNQYGNDAIHLVEEVLDYKQVLALYTITEVAIFGTFWDGFNTIPYEITAAQDQSASPAVVIVSEFMGCSRSLSGVICINPCQLSQLSNAIHKALVFTNEEKRNAHHQRQRHVMSYTFGHWAEGFLKDLRKASEAEVDKNVIPMGFGSQMKWVYLPSDFVQLKEMESLLVESFKHSKKRILLFDYGGTLSEIEEDSVIYRRAAYFSRSSSDLISFRKEGKPGSKIAPSVLRNLQILSSDPDSIVSIVSGQTKKEIEKAFGACSDLCLAAEKGAYYRWPGDEDWTRNPKLGDNTNWYTIAVDVLRMYSERTDGAYTQEKDTALVWHYHDTDPDYGNMQATELERYLKRILQPYHSITVQRYDHERVLEVLPQEIHKGSAAVTIIERMVDDMSSESVSLSKDYADVFILAIGNDRSDEKMFEAVELSGKQLKSEHVFSCTIGLQPTQARFYLTQQKEIKWLLNLLAGCSRLTRRKSSGDGPASEYLRRSSYSPRRPIQTAASFGGYMRRGAPGQYSSSGSTGNLQAFFKQNG